MVGVMGTEAFGAYIRALRERHKLTQAGLGGLIGVTGNTIYRIETGQQAPETPNLVALLAALGGRIRDVQRLLSGAADVSEVEQMADEAMTEQRLIAMADTDPKRRALLRRIAELSDDPDLTSRIEGYLDGLKAGRQDS